MTTQFLVNLPKFLNGSLRAVVFGTTLLAQLVWASDPTVSNANMAPNRSENAVLVGNVSLVLGKAYLQTEDRGRQTIRVGTPIAVNDRIYTEANGHVHVRFVDQALVSVRPDSQLEIVRYDFDAAKPEQSSVKFNLVEGVTRAISGEAAKAARQRFRLNTPIAAIGVRGTDFVVSTTNETVRALVTEGAIVMAPYSSQCSADDFGPCAFNAVELTDASLQVIELDGNDIQPQLLPAPHERDPASIRDDVQLAIATVEDEADDKTAGTGVYLENVTSSRLTKEAATITPPLPPPVKPPAVVQVPEFTPKTTVASTDLKSRQLVWGRWGVGQGALERITVNYADSRPGLEVTVGNSDYLLLRPEFGTQRVDAGLGVVSFALNSAQAFYHSASGVVAMQVSGGKLGIDFDRSQFETQLNLNHSLTGKIDFFASGKVSEQGYFNSRSPTQNIAGSVSVDGKEAGYFFDKQLQNGGIQGLTLWDKQ